MVERDSLSGRRVARVGSIGSPTCAADHSRSSAPTEQSSTSHAMLGSQAERGVAWALHQRPARPCRTGLLREPDRASCNTTEVSEHLFRSLPAARHTLELWQNGSQTPAPAHEPDGLPPFAFVNRSAMDHNPDATLAIIEGNKGARSICLCYADHMFLCSSEGKAAACIRDQVLVQRSAACSRSAPE